MRLLICAHTYERALEKLEELSKDIPDIRQYRKSRNEAVIETYCGDYYKAVAVNEYSKGFRCDKLYVDQYLDYRIVKTILLPFLLKSETPENDRVIYY